MPIKARNVVPKIAQSNATTTRGYAIAPIRGNSVTLLDSIQSFAFTTGETIKFDANTKRRTI